MEGKIGVEIYTATLEKFSLPWFPTIPNRERRFPRRACCFLRTARRLHPPRLLAESSRPPAIQSRDKKCGKSQRINLIMASYPESRVSFNCLHEVTGEAVVRRVDDERLVVEEGVVGVEDIAGHNLADCR